MQFIFEKNTYISSYEIKTDRDLWNKEYEKMEQNLKFTSTTIDPKVISQRFGLNYISMICAIRIFITVGIFLHFDQTLSKYQCLKNAVSSNSRRFWLVCFNVKKIRISRKRYSTITGECFRWVNSCIDDLKRFSRCSKSNVRINKISKSTHWVVCILI